MTKEIGLWIDHRQAVIVTSLDEAAETKRITAGRGESHDGTEDGHDRHSGEQLKQYYDEIIPYLLDATAILIIGPGEAKGELQKRLDAQGFQSGTVTVENADNMTDNQIAAEIRQHFGQK